jgi:hypothetical protein
LFAVFLEFLVSPEWEFFGTVVRMIDDGTGGRLSELSTAPASSFHLWFSAMKEFSSGSLPF